MSHRNVRKNWGGMWGAGVGILALLVTTTIIIILFAKQTDTLVDSSKGTIRAQEEAKKVVNQINQHNANVDNTVAQQTSPSPSPQSSAPATASPAPEAPARPATSASASPVPAASAAPSPAAPAPAGGGAPSAGAPIGPISPVTPVAPITEGQGPNLKGAATRPAGTGDLRNIMGDRNKELEDALNGK